MDRIKDKVAIITGGSRGIGKAISTLLAKEGAKVAIVDINFQGGEDLKKEINESKGIAEFWQMDVSKEDQVKSVFYKIKTNFGKIDILVNNTGISGVNKQTHEVSIEEWQKVIDINQTGVFLCTKHVIPYMQKNGRGSIINISSIHGIVGAGEEAPYGATKAAVRLMTKNDALFYAKNNIRVNSIHPGFIWTPMLEEYAKQLGIDLKQQLYPLQPIGHIGEPNDIAYGVLYLASEESKFVTGAELIIDGGFISR